MSASDAIGLDKGKGQQNDTTTKSSITITQGRLSKKSAGFFTLLYASRRIFLLPYHLLSNILRSRRANPKWSFKTAIGVVIYRTVFLIVADIHSSSARSLLPGKEKDVFISIEPASPASEHYQGPLASSVVKPVTIPAFWAPAAPSHQVFPENTLLILHFHPGAYVSLTARQPEARKPPGQLAKKLGSAFALLPDYRKASDPGYSHFPAQLQDAVSAYSHALKLVSSPDQIILSGDSAGGHIVASLIRYLEQYQTLPKPKAAVLHSPWVNLTSDAVTVQNHPLGDVDYLPTSWLAWGAESFTPPGLDRTNEWISPVYHPFKTTIPMWVQAGEKEVFYDSIAEFVSKMKSEGTQIELWTAPEAPHDIWGAASDVGMEKEADDAMNDAVRFLLAL